MKYTTYSAQSQYVRDRSVTCESCGHNYLLVDRVFGAGESTVDHGFFNVIASQDGSAFQKGQSGAGEIACRRAQKLALRTPFAFQRCPRCGRYDKDSIVIILETYRRERRSRANSVAIMQLLGFLLFWTIIVPVIVALMLRKQKLMQGFTQRKWREDDVNHPDRCARWVAEWRTESPWLTEAIVDRREDIQDTYRKLEELRRRHDFVEPPLTPVQTVLPARMERRQKNERLRELRENQRRNDPLYVANGLIKAENRLRAAKALLITASVLLLLGAYPLAFGGGALHERTSAFLLLAAYCVVAPGLVGAFLLRDAKRIRRDICGAAGL